MGFFDSFRHGVAILGPKIRWSEPARFEDRLARRTLGARLYVAIAAPIVGIVAMFVIGSGNPTFTPLLGAFLGAVFGGCVSVIALGRSFASATVVLDKNGLHRSRTWASGLLLAFETEDWPHGAITQCCIVPYTRSGHNFSCLVVDTPDGRDRIGVPPNVDLAEVARFFQGYGVPVSAAGGALPAPRPVGPLAVLTKRPAVLVALPVAIGLIAVVATRFGQADRGNPPVNDAPARVAPAGLADVPEPPRPEMPRPETTWPETTQPDPAIPREARPAQDHSFTGSAGNSGDLPSESFGGAVPSPGGAPQLPKGVGPGRPPSYPPPSSLPPLPGRPSRPRGGPPGF